eukprot:ANDGO_03937.mRNA.1 hypothetical protein
MQDLASHRASATFHTARDAPHSARAGEFSMSRKLPSAGSLNVGRRSTHMLSARVQRPSAFLVADYRVIPQMEAPQGPRPATGNVLPRFHTSQEYTAIGQNGLKGSPPSSARGTSVSPNSLLEQSSRRTQAILTVLDMSANAKEKVAPFSIDPTIVPPVSPSKVLLSASPRSRRTADQVSFKIKYEKSSFSRISEPARGSGTPYSETAGHPLLQKVDGALGDTVLFEPRKPSTAAADTPRRTRNLPHLTPFLWNGNDALSDLSASNLVPKPAVSSPSQVRSPRRRTPRHDFFDTDNLDASIEVDNFRRLTGVHIEIGKGSIDQLLKQQAASLNASTTSSSPRMLVRRFRSVGGMHNGSIRLEIENSLPAKKEPVEAVELVSTSNTSTSSRSSSERADRSGNVDISGQLDGWQEATVFGGRHVLADDFVFVQDTDGDVLPTSVAGKTRHHHKPKGSLKRRSYSSNSTGRKLSSAGSGKRPAHSHKLGVKAAAAAAHASCTERTGSAGASVEAPCQPRPPVTESKRATSASSSNQFRMRPSFDSGSVATQ